MGRDSSDSDSDGTGDGVEEKLDALTGAEQRWLAICRAAVAEGPHATSALLDSPEADVLAWQSRAVWHRDSEDGLLHEEGDGSSETGRLAADFSAARAMGALAGALTGSMPIEEGCAIHREHADRAGLYSAGSQLVSADSPIIRGDARLREIVLRLLGSSPSPSRGYGILLALELAGRRPPTRQVARTPVLFAGYTAAGRHGEMGLLRVELLDHGPSGLHPDPARMGFLQADDEFTDGLAEAWNGSRLADSDACVVWSITVGRGAPANAIVGGSIAAAVGVVLDDLSPRHRVLRYVRPRKLDRHCAVTAGLADGKLTPVSGYADKLEVAQRHSLRVVVAADAHAIAAREAPHHFDEQIAAAATLDEAIRLARTRINHRLWMVLAAVLVVISTVAGVGIQSARVRAVHADEQARSDSWFYASVSRLVEGRDPAFAQQLALAAYHTRDTLPARSALLDSTSLNTPIRIAAPASYEPTAIEDAPQLAAGADGDVFATGEGDGTIRLTRVDDVGAKSWPPVDTGLGHIRGLAMGAGSRLLVVAGDRGVGVWDTTDPAAPERLHELSVDGHGPSSAAISPNGRYIAVGCRDGALFVWELGAEASAVRRDDYTIADSSQLTVALSDRMLAAFDSRQLGRDRYATRVWAWQLDSPNREPALYQEIERGDLSFGRAMDFSPDGRTLAFALDPPEILRWSVDDPAEPWPLPPVPGFGVLLRHLSFSADGKYIATVDDEQMVRIRDVDSGVFVATIPSPMVARAVFFRRGRSVATVGVDHAVRVTDAPGPTVTVAPQTWYQFSDGQGPISWEVLQRLRALGYPASAQQVGRDLDPAAFRRLVVVSPDGTRAVTMDNTGVQVWAIDAVDNVRKLGPPIAGYPLLEWVGTEFHPDGRLAIPRGLTNDVALWDVAGDLPSLDRVIRYEAGFPSVVAFSADGRHMAIGGLFNGSVRVYDMHGNRAVFELNGVDVGAGLLSLAVSPSGLLAVGNRGGVRLYDTSDPTPGEPRELSGVPVTSVSFSSDGGRLAASAPTIGRVDLWDTSIPDKPSHYARLTGGQRRTTPTSVSFGAGDTTLTETSVGGRITEWRIDAAAEAERICRSGTVMLEAAQVQAYLPGVPWTQPCPGR